MTAACQLCGGTDFELVSERDRHGKPLRTVLCRGCGSVTNDPIPTDEELAAFYRSDYRTSYKGVPEPRMRQIWRNFRRLEEDFAANSSFYRGRSSCLDLGSGSGEFTFLAGRAGMKVTGIEPNEVYAEYSRRHFGLDVLTQTLEETRFEPGRFDLIRLSHVMEHMRDPVRSLKVLREWLSDNGLLYIVVPNVELEAGRKVRGRMFHYGHIFNFSPWTFRAAARLAGFEEHPESAARYGGDTVGFFRKGPFATAADAVSRENAARISAALKAHRERALPAPQGDSPWLRGVSTLAERVTEFVASSRFSTPRQIADASAERLDRAGVLRDKAA